MGRNDCNRDALAGFAAAIYAALSRSTVMLWPNALNPRDGEPRRILSRRPERLQLVKAVCVVKAQERRVVLSSEHPRKNVCAVCRIRVSKLGVRVSLCAHRCIA